MLPSSAASRVTTRADNIRARVEQRLRRYPAAVQTAVRAAARVHPHVADLAVSFPGLLFAIATARRPADREALLAAVLAGDALACVAVRASLPMWLRKLPPEAFTGPLPPLPDGALFSRQIANHLPPPKLAAVWLDVVTRAAQRGHEGLAVWFAREIVREPKCAKRLGCLDVMSLWAWYAANVPAEQSFIMRPWHPAMRFETALACADAWRSRVELHLNIGSAPIADMWLQPSTVEGHEFVPLDTARAIAEEGCAMNNCVCSYGHSLAHNWTRLWSIRRDGARIATVSVVWSGDDPLPLIGELQLASNKKAPVELWLIARRWLNGHDLQSVDMQQYKRGQAPLDPALWRSFWRPYWLAKRGVPQWLPLAPSRAALRAL